MGCNTRKLILAGASTVIVLAAVTSLVCTSRLSSTGPRTVQANQAEPGSPVPSSSTSTGPPEINAAAFKGQGRLAFVCGGLLYVLDGQTGAVRQLTTDGITSQPVWSHDGEWLAYMRATDQQSASDTLWLARWDGTQAHQVPVPAVFDSFSHLFWLGADDVLEVSGQNGVWLVPVTGATRQLADDPGVVSPDGKSLAYSVTPPYDSKHPEDWSDSLFTIATNGGQPVQRLTASQGDGIIVVGWWPDSKGLLYWLDREHSADAMADGVNLYSLRLGNNEPKLLTSGLSRQGWLSTFPPHNLLMVNGGGRIVWADKNLALINVESGQIKDLKNPAGCVAIDPSISADGSRIAFVAAKDLGDNVWGFNNAQDLAVWVASRTLWVENADGSGAHPLTSAGQVYQPLWSQDGRRIMYVKDNSLWLIGADGGEPAKIYSPLAYEDPLAGAFGYFGFISYQDEVAWYQPWGSGATAERAPAVTLSCR